MINNFTYGYLCVDRCIVDEFLLRPIAKSGAQYVLFMLILLNLDIFAVYQMSASYALF